MNKFALVAALLGLIGAVGFIAYQNGVSDEKERRHTDRSKQEEERRNAEPWAKVEKTATIGEGESLRLLKIKGEDEFSDKECLLYVGISSLIVCGDSY